MKRLFDIVFSLFGIILLVPIFLLIAVFIIFDSKGKIVYKQVRVGKNGKDFFVFKFRTMISNAEKKGLLTVGAKDSRITRVGFFLRKYKLDELPQLANVLIGDMSFVGPRPEVRKYVNMYNEEQLQVLSVRPGITDYASIQFANENELLGKVSNPEEVYVNEVMPEKLLLNLKYIREKNFFKDVKIIFKTFIKILA
ncbi:MAG TPA: sugar transferase [Bacteroidia bacterium]|nr:sugar transferase [Bacteroidia bacterium]